IAQPESGHVELSSPGDATEREARAMESRVGEVHVPAGTAAAPAPLPTARVRNLRRKPVEAAPAPVEAPHAEPASPSGGKRASANIFGDAANWVGDRIDDVENWAEDKIEGLIAKVAPGIITLIKEGPGGLIKDALEPAIKGWVSSITG